MITDFFLGAILWLLNFLIGLLPVVEINATFSGYLLSISRNLALWNNILPLSTVLTCVLLIIAVELSILIYRIVDKVRKMLPTQS